MANDGVFRFKHKKTFLMLQKEGFLSRTCLTTGLTALRVANLNERGHYYAAFFNLSIGLERIMKIIIIIDHMAANRLSAPSNKVLRDHGHDLVSLVKSIQHIERRYGLSKIASLCSEKIPNKLIEFLSEFADSTRYYNLDALTSATQDTDPLIAWNDMVIEINGKHLNINKKRKIYKEAEMINKHMGRNTFVSVSDLNGDPLDLKGVYLQPHLQENAARYAVFYIVKWVDALNDLVTLAYKAVHDIDHNMDSYSESVPYMDEFYDFAMLNKSDILNKKHWP